MLVKEVAGRDSRILEIGCNIGRNLQHLSEAGFRNLEGIEISEEAVRELRATFPELAATARIHNAPAEEVLPSLEDRRYDLTFTVAVLEHIHRESEWVFQHIARVTRDTLITIEDEKTSPNVTSLETIARCSSPWA
jgi:SAM-dependent methyltransferase